MDKKRKFENLIDMLDLLDGYLEYCLKEIKTGHNHLGQWTDMILDLDVCVLLTLITKNSDEHLKEFLKSSPKNDEEFSASELVAQLNEVEDFKKAYNETYEIRRHNPDALKGGLYPDSNLSLNERLEFAQLICNTTSSFFKVSADGIKDELVDHLCYSYTLRDYAKLMASGNIKYDKKFDIFLNEKFKTLSDFMPKEIKERYESPEFKESLKNRLDDYNNRQR